MCFFLFCFQTRKQKSRGLKIGFMDLGKGVVALFTESLLLSHQVGSNLVDEDLFT